MEGPGDLQPCMGQIKRCWSGSRIDIHTSLRFFGNLQSYRWAAFAALLHATFGADVEHYLQQPTVYETAADRAVHPLPKDMYQTLAKRWMLLAEDVKRLGY